MQMSCEMQIISVQGPPCPPRRPDKSDLANEDFSFSPPVTKRGGKSNEQGFLTLLHTIGDSWDMRLRGSQEF